VLTGGAGAIGWRVAYEQELRKGWRGWQGLLGLKSKSRNRARARPPEMAARR